MRKNFTKISCLPFIADHGRLCSLSGPFRATVEFRTFSFGQETATIRIPRPPSHDRIFDIQCFPDYVAKALPVSSVVADGLWDGLGASLGLSIFAVDYIIQGSIPKIFELIRYSAGHGCRTRVSIPLQRPYKHSSRSGKHQCQTSQFFYI
jgi:hypothetical protein